MKRVLLIGIGFFLLLGNAEGAEKLTLDRFLSLVKQHNKNIQLAGKSLETAKAMKKEAWATALPKLNAQATYNRNLLTNYIYINFPDFRTGMRRPQNMHTMRRFRPFLPVRKKHFFRPYCCKKW